MFDHAVLELETKTGKGFQQDDSAEIEDNSLRCAITPSLVTVHSPVITSCICSWTTEIRRNGLIFCSFPSL